MINKKVIFGFLIAFIISLNIYNIPISSESEKAEAKVSVKDNNLSIDVGKFNSVINKSTGQSFNFNDYDSIIVSFWATWCPSCKKENQLFNKLTVSNKSTLIIGVCMDKDKSLLDEYLVKMPLKFPVLYNNKDIAMMFDDVYAVPTNYIISVRTGSMVKRLGMISESDISNISKGLF